MREPDRFCSPSGFSSAGVLPTGLMLRRWWRRAILTSSGVVSSDPRPHCCRAHVSTQVEGERCGRRYPSITIHRGGGRILSVLASGGTSGACCTTRLLMLNVTCATKRKTLFDGRASLRVIYAALRNERLVPALPTAMSREYFTRRPASRRLKPTVTDAHRLTLSSSSGASDLWLSNQEISWAQDDGCRSSTFYGYGILAHQNQAMTRYVDRWRSSAGGRSVASAGRYPATGEGANTAECQRKNATSCARNRSCLRTPAGDGNAAQVSRYAAPAYQPGHEYTQRRRRHRTAYAVCDAVNNVPAIELPERKQIQRRSK